MVSFARRQVITDVNRLGDHRAAIGADGNLSNGIARRNNVSFGNTALPLPRTVSSRGRIHCRSSPRFRRCSDQTLLFLKATPCHSALAALPSFIRPCPGVQLLRSAFVTANTASRPSSIL